MTLKVERYTLTTQTYGTPLICPIKRYTRLSEAPIDPKDPGIILLLGHGAGFFKETWEPTIEDLFKIDAKKVIREAWGLDCQNHGEGCIVNEEALARNPRILTIWDYADAFATLFKSGLLGPVNPKLHPVVLCGHSAGAVGVTLSTSYFNPPSRIPFSSIILVDPPIWGKDKDGQDSDIYKLVETMTPIRKDIWTSNDEATHWLKSRLPWGSWEERVFDAYVKYGLRSLPTAFYPDKTGTTLATHRLAENIAFTGKLFAYDALNRLNQICAHIPVHLIFGDNADMFERDVQESIINPKEGRNFASVTRLENVGHLVVQESPSKLAAALFSILQKSQALPSKL
ncbi:hypothetical protein GALMADRAFT_127350 [Galerina marginata CBS 339.88]|uniref:AB hydrolase-1 domain-containing protein n=1 Tax=Galerina marginata (strain CBS 339.88) TaxID=685588 RepID=A0A067SM77_GALM3|nr:hypothetical protein GALMADRAFT_127350 [Galerina marginata CBS 339.88]